jgi:anaerobic ribonucleoside-triphosphate reductase
MCRYLFKGEAMKQNEILQKSEEERTKCIVYTRVMGYHRPVESFNIGKKGEHKERKFFLERALRVNAA